MARYRIEHPQHPWQISLAQHGESRVDFLDENIASDLEQIRFRWPDRTQGDCSLERVFEGEEIWQSVWSGVCRSAGGGELAIEIGARERPDLGRSLATSQTDLDILERAMELLTAEAWNRADDRICSDDISTGRYSLFCAVYHASLIVHGEYLHRRPAARVLRDTVHEAGEARIESHTLMDYNNPPETTHAEILARLSEAASALRGDLA